MLRSNAPRTSGGGRPRREAAAKKREEEERRRKKEEAKAARRSGFGRLFGADSHDEYDDDEDDETPIEPIPDIVERLRYYSRDQATSRGDDEQPPASQTVEPETRTIDTDSRAPSAVDCGSPATAARARVGHTGVMSQVVEAPVEVREPSHDDAPLDERPWVVIVWNDPINLMSYVTLVLQQLFGYSRAKATGLMLQVHNEGKAAVSSGTREKAELDVSRLHAHGLWATMQQD